MYLSDPHNFLLEHSWILPFLAPYFHAIIAERHQPEFLRAYSDALNGSNRELVVQAMSGKLESIPELRDAITKKIVPLMAMCDLELQLKAINRGMFDSVDRRELFFAISWKDYSRALDSYIAHVLQAAMNDEEKVGILCHQVLQPRHRVWEALPNHTHRLFGSKIQPGSEIISHLEGNDGIKQDVAESLLDENDCFSWMQYSRPGSELLILHSYNRAYSLEGVTIYDFSRLQKSGYPGRVNGNELSEKHEIYPQLPKFVQIMIQNPGFNYTAYRHSEVIRVVGELLMSPILKHDRKLGDQMQQLIFKFISLAGEDVKIAVLPEDSVRVKNDMNELCHKVSQELIKIIENSLQTLRSPRDIAMLGFFLGSLAKIGVLGYHEAGGLNRANEVMYKLALKCFESIEHDRSIRFPGRFFSDLRNGGCIQLAMNNFSVQNNWVREIFQQRPDRPLMMSASRNRTPAPFLGG
jgi:hypothetical protein